MNVLSDLSVLYHLALPTAGETQEERLDSFYRKQASHYDSFRKKLLHGRETLYAELASTLKPGMTWVDIGGGTGANCESLGDRLNLLKKFYIVDLSTALLEVAEGRIYQNDWKNVETVRADATNLDLPVEADIVTFSYSLTMIPHWWSALERAKTLLKPGGLIGISDFYVAEKFPSPTHKRHPWGVRHLWPLWFSFDNVFLNPDHVPYLHRHFRTQYFREEEGRIPYLMGLRAPYYLFIGKKE